jgi:hypothetical protein
MATNPEKTTLEVPTFGDHVQSLPAELFNDIYELVFAAEPGEVSVDESYMPPTQLQASNPSREMFATSYYSHKTFVFTESIIMGKWLLALEKTHVRRISCVRYLYKCLRAQIHNTYRCTTSELHNSLIDDLHTLGIAISTHVYETAGVDVGKENERLIWQEMKGFTKWIIDQESKASEKLRASWKLV